MRQTARRIAIVGFGPRGLGALEALVRIAEAQDKPLAVDLFDPVDWPAAGPNFSPDESPVCLLNLPLRSIDLPSPLLGGAVDSFAAWLAEDGHDGEAFLPRAQLGAYLNARFADLRSRLPDHISVTLHDVRVTAAQRDGLRWRLHADARVFGPYDHVLLSLGQPETGDDEQMARWRAHADRYGLPLVSAYPGAALLQTAESWAGQIVGIRGLGLSALDVVRMLTLGLGGRFETERYLPSGREPARIVPFSLDGQAPAPKPSNAALDARFDPLKEEDAAFEAALLAAISGPGEAALPTLSAAIEASALRILRQTGGTGQLAAVCDWLAVEFEDPGSQERRETLVALSANIAEADGAEPPSIGYVIGQLWRKWQPMLRRIYDSSPVPVETARALVGLDESLKRYSYGPPVATARQLMTLIQAGLVDARAADDPDVALVAQGWRLHSDDRSVTANVMVESVLPPAALEPVTDPLVTGLRRTSAMLALGNGLGAQCTPDGELIGDDGAPVNGLWLAGRLANGSAIAGDSIHDCFGGICARWAQAVLIGMQR